MDHETIHHAVVPLRGATGAVEAVVELTWDPPEPEANTRDAIASLVAISGPTLVRVGLDALMDERRKRSELRYEFGAALSDRSDRAACRASGRGILDPVLRRRGRDGRPAQPE